MYDTTSFKFYKSIQENPLFKGYSDKQLRRWINWHIKNQQVWSLFLEVARELKADGFKSYSAMTIMGLVRYRLSSPKTGEFKVNNTYAPLYARNAIRKFPQEFKTFFEIRSK